MCFRIACCAIVVFAANPPVGFGQQSREQVQELRRQFESLAAQLQRLEQPQDRAERSERVTQIGSFRHGRTSETIVRIYDLSDLFAIAPAYEAMHMNDLGGVSYPLFPSSTSRQLSTAGGMGGGMGGGMFNVGSPTHRLPAAASSVLAQRADLGEDESNGRATIDELINAIEQSVAPDSWNDNGGEGSIARVGSALLISADRATHQQIDALLSLFRQRWRTLRTVTVRADWLWLTRAQLRSLIPTTQQETTRDVGRQSPIVVDDIAWAALFDDKAQDDRESRGYSAALSCYNGQTVHTESGDQSLVVTDMTPIALGAQDAKGAISPAYRPAVIVVQEGAALQITPLATRNAKFVVLDVHSRVSRLRKLAAKPRAAEDRRPADRTIMPEEVVSALDRPTLTTHRLSTTLRIPVDRTVLVGGMTFESKPAGDDFDLYLFVRSSVQELRDDEAVGDASPTPNDPGKSSLEEPREPAKPAPS